MGQQQSTQEQTPQRINTPSPRKKKRNKSQRISHEKKVQQQFIRHDAQTVNQDSPPAPIEDKNPLSPQYDGYFKPCALDAERMCVIPVPNISRWMIWDAAAPSPLQSSVDTVGNRPLIYSLVGNHTQEEEASSSSTPQSEARATDQSPVNTTVRSDIDGAASDAKDSFFCYSSCNDDSSLDMSRIEEQASLEQVYSASEDVGMDVESSSRQASSLLLWGACASSEDDDQHIQDSHGFRSRKSISYGQRGIQRIGSRSIKVSRHKSISRSRSIEYADSPDTAGTLPQTSGSEEEGNTFTTLRRTSIIERLGKPAFGRSPLGMRKDSVRLNQLRSAISPVENVPDEERDFYDEMKGGMSGSAIRGINPLLLKNPDIKAKADPCASIPMARRMSSYSGSRSDISVSSDSDDGSSVGNDKADEELLRAAVASNRSLRAAAAARTLSESPIQETVSAY